MNAIEQLRATHRQAQVAGDLEQALRGLTDLLTSDDLEGEALYGALEDAVIAACDALDTWESSTDPSTEVPDTGTTADEAPAAVPDDDDLVDCQTCGTPTRRSDFPRIGRGQSRSCSPCVSKRNRRNIAKRHSQREPETAQEPV